ncbi:histone H1-like [Synchiropus splendidus]|uniref:histone H1-like n=1 Tax=Synchiropus splendidus TaxID=270530 RepID=UPI00237E7775|nr:histone H1-like [Synchiropus splendidus]
MAEEAPALAPAAVKAPKAKKKSSGKKSPGLGLRRQILAAVAESKERRGVSTACIKKRLLANGVDVPKVNRRINLVIRKLVESNALEQTRGTGASGSFKIPKKEVKASKPVRRVAKKKAGEKKKAVEKKKGGEKKKAGEKRKSAGGKKPAAKKPAAKKASTKASPKKKPKKAGAKKTAPKTARRKSAPKTKRSPAKKTPKKSAAAKGPKRSPAKRSASKKSKK